MKRLIYIFATLVALVITACGPEIDETMVAMDDFMNQQNVPGLYRQSKVEFAFDASKHQCYLSPSQLTYRIMDEGGDKYIEFILSKSPVVNESIDVDVKSYGLGLSSKTTYKNLTVKAIENNRCTLRSSAEGGYVGIIIDWIE